MIQNECIHFQALMPTAAERQALAFLAGVALLGGGVRVWQQRHANGNDSAAVVMDSNAESVDGQLSAIDAVRSSRRSKKGAAKPKSPARSSTQNKRGTQRSTKGNDEPRVVIDVDVATAAELERLPRVGTALAERIVANRDSLGAFGSLEALGTVRGIGDVMLKSLDPLVTFSGRPRARMPIDNVRAENKRKRTSKPKMRS